MYWLLTTATTRSVVVVVALLLCGEYGRVRAQGAEPAEETAWLTNLSQLRRCAEQQPLNVRPLRIVATVFDSDSTAGVLVLRDSSGTEFIQVEPGGEQFEPGATIRLEGKGCAVKPRSFGLAIVPGMVVDNDGIHGMIGQSGTTFLRAGLNPLNLHWFNRLGDVGLTLEYEGPDLPRRRVRSSALVRAQIDPATGRTNFTRGLDYKCYEGAWGYLPEFTKFHPVKTGVVTNFNLDVRTRQENVGLEFDGFIKIPRDGFYTFHLTSDDGACLMVGEPSLDIRELRRGPFPQAAEKAAAASPETNTGPWVTLEGIVDFAGIRESGGELTMRVGNKEVYVRLFAGGQSTAKFPLNNKVRVSGFYQNVLADDGSPAGMLLALSWSSVRPLPESLSVTAQGNREPVRPPAEDRESAGTTPALSTVAQIKALSSEVADQQLPVSIRGVVIATLPSFIRGAVVQDPTKGVFVSLSQLPQDTKLLERGEFCQVDGVTGPGLFAPIIVANRIMHLGPAQMPQPVHATWDELINGSLDTQYIELEGLLTAVHDQQILMLLEGGKITLDIDDFQSETLRGWENALVRIRGCAFSAFNQQTHELEPKELRIAGGALELLEPAPRDLFDISKKSLRELLLYDPKAAPFRRIKVNGQVIAGRTGEFFLEDGTIGLHVTTRNSDGFAVGDLVEAVGFLDLGGPAAELKEAVMRKTGHAALPMPIKISPEHLLQARYAGTLVQVEARLMNQWREGSEYVLELQSGFLAFRAWMDSHGVPISLPPSGSRLALTGVYVPQGNRAVDETLSGFELRVHAPTDLRVLATPPWWNLKRVLILAGLLAVLLLAALIWNKQLQRKVRIRSRQLETEIRNRQQAELKHAAEAERARIARDLHDELGTGLTEVSLLASTVVGESSVGERSNDRFRVIAEKARALVSGLDVIVWAIDPRRNSLQSFTDYLGRYVTELFSATTVVCRFKIPIECDGVTLTEAARHSLFLAVKEALNNVLRHSSASEVALQISQSGERLHVVIADNGRGFDWKSIRRVNGLRNLQERLESLNGSCQIESQPGRGTTVEFTIPLPEATGQPQRASEFQDIA